MPFWPTSDVDNEDLPLDQEQVAAVHARESAIAVLAGPGSGKTRVLSYRARHLLIREPTARALLLTFTNKAAAEMKARALGVAIVSSDRILASTFHTFGMRVLHAHGDLADIGREFQVMEDDERAELAEEAAVDAGVRELYWRWSHQRLRRRQVRNDELLAFGRSYEAGKRGRNLVDFDDLIVYTADLFEHHPEVAEAYATRYRHLLVDEFQDTNAAQFAIVKALAQTAGSVSVFADDDQAIYRFAGAEAENIQRFVRELGATQYPLTVNYRCRQRIVQCADGLIAADPRASGRRMRAFHPGGDVRCLAFASAAEEASRIAEEIDELIQRGETRPYEIAVLARSGFRVQQLLVELENRAVPVTSWLGQSYETEERRILRTCLSVIRGDLDDRQARRLYTLLDVAELADRDPQVILRRHSQLRTAALLMELRDRAWAGESALEVVKVAQLAVAAIDPALGAAVSSIVDAVAVFQEYDPEFSLEHLLAELALGGVGGPPTIGGGVKVASLHRTKGLQWPRVYLVGLEEGRLPDYHAQTGEDISEERRACFVGVCRTEESLTLTRVRYDRNRQQLPSRFLAETGIRTR